RTVKRPKAQKEWPTHPLRERAGGHPTRRNTMTRLRWLPVLLLLSAPAAAADWPQWLGPKRDGASTETVKPWKGELKVLWRKPVGAGHRSPVVANGKVYLHTRVSGKEAEAITAYDAKSGNEVWTKSYPRDKFFSPFGTGPQATPAVSDG